MRIATYPIIESDIAFDFSAAVWCEKHDQTNTVFPGIDFIIEEVDQQIWLEVKNWEGASVPLQRRGGQRRSFLAKIVSRAYFNDTLRAKFIGTAAYFAFTGRLPSKLVLYIVLLESPRMTADYKSLAQTRLRGLIERSRLWSVPVTTTVVTLADWQALFPQYPARALS